MQKSRHFSKENCLLCGADFILLISYYFFKIVKLPIALQNDNLVTIWIYLGSDDTVFVDHAIPVAAIKGAVYCA